MIGRADIEGSKSNVAMNAWLPQASYPCGNFSDTSSFEFRRSKGSLGHAFTVRIRTGTQNQTSFYPSVPHEISVLVALILGHLRYLLTDVPPQPNSPPDNVFLLDRPASQAQQGLLSPLILPSPFPWLWFHWIVDRVIGNLVNPFIWIPLVRTGSELAVRRARKALCLNVWNRTHATLEKQEANSGKVISQHFVGFFKDGCMNLLWRWAAGWLDWMGRDEPERQRAESQWIVAARPLCHLQYPVAYLSCLQRTLPAARWKLYFKAATATLPPQRLSQRHVPLGAEAPTAGRQSDGGRMRRF
ncbi:Regulator of rDNA transcription protein 15 [Capsicum baccatum]|uniref:Regulator of rDNA transcription protein 15 n=1 Tax=Capsicum baccatum TaxID=33114 RepID=A0A2G2UZ05_CAPBA|nr:Regulator of rDNA transcription protein 15 [Capsicum baccatum]